MFFLTGTESIDGNAELQLHFTVLRASGLHLDLFKSRCSET